LFALRIACGKMCHLQVTLGLVTPWRTKRLPVVLSVGEVQRLLEATPHSPRHSFACHTYEYTCDLRKKKILGHVRPETTTIYVRVARPAADESITGPLDVLARKREQSGNRRAGNRPTVGKRRIHFNPCRRTVRNRAGPQ
jgi:integrase